MAYSEDGIDLVSLSDQERTGSFKKVYYGLLIFFFTFAVSSFLWNMLLWHKAVPITCAAQLLFLALMTVSFYCMKAHCARFKEQVRKSKLLKTAINQLIYVVFTIAELACIVAAAAGLLVYENIGAFSPLVIVSGSLIGVLANLIIGILVDNN